MRPETRPGRIADVVALHGLIGCGEPDAPAVTFGEQTLTYAELASRVARAAAGLRALGVGRGDRVIVFAEKRLETVVAFFAASAAGAVLVPANPLMRPRQLAYVADDCAARLIVTTDERLGAVREALTAGGTRGVTDVVVIGGSGQALLPVPTAGWEQVAAADAEPFATVIDADVAAIMYTSGSTGGPKGVVLTHRNLVVGALSVAQYLEHTAADTILSVLPLSFDAGFSQVTTAFAAGAHVVLLNYLTPRGVVRLCAQHRVTALTCVPPLWLQLAAQRWPDDATRSLRYFANTGGRMPRTTLDALRATFPQAAPYLMYGLTEAFRSTYLDPRQVDARPDSIGKAIPNAEVAVLRPDGTRCAPGEHGELVHRGALVSLGYWNDPERTAQRFRPVPRPGVDGVVGPELAVWSGDTAYADEQGYLFFVGRTDDMIKTSGYRVSPTEIEEAVYATGQVDEVIAFGLPHDELGHQIAVVVTAPCDPVLLRKALSEELPPYMVPHRVVVVDELPRSANGKFDRVAVRRAVEETA